MRGFALKARVLGVDHQLQWRDATGSRLRDLLSALLAKEDAGLIAEEATGLPTTVAQRLAFRLGKPWLNVDMDECQRRAAGIYDELAERPFGPLFDGNGDQAGVTEGHLPNADGVREGHWLSQIIKYGSGSVIMLCGVLHLSPFAERLRGCGYEVKEINVCELDWCVNEFGGSESSRRTGDGCANTTCRASTRRAGCHRFRRPAPPAPSRSQALVKSLAIGW